MFFFYVFCKINSTCQVSTPLLCICLCFRSASVRSTPSGRQLTFTSACRQGRPPSQGRSLTRGMRRMHHNHQTWVSTDATVCRMKCKGLFQIMAWAHQVTSHYQKPWRRRSPTSYGITKVSRSLLLLGNDTILYRRTWSTLYQVMSCCLAAPSLYLNHCLLIISEVLWHSSTDNIRENASDIYP